MAKGNTNPAKMRHEWEVQRLARDYVIDFDLERAAVRCNIDIDQAKRYYEEPVFANTVRDIIDMIEPETVVARNEILMGLKAIAFGPGKNADKINALKELARLTGMDLPTKHQHEVNAPVIKLTLAPAKDAGPS